jgi:hypothetical protein
MSQSQKDSDAQLGQGSEGALTREDSKKDIHDDENMDPDDEDEDEDEEEDSDDPAKEELADREERICSVEAEAAAERAFGEMCPDDLKTTKITFAHYIDEKDCITRVHYKKLSLDVNMVCAFLLPVCMNT